MNFLRLTGISLAIAVSAAVFAHAGIWPWSEEGDTPVQQENITPEPAENELDVSGDFWTVTDAEDDLRLIEEGIHGTIPEPLESGGPIHSEDGADNEVLKNEDAKFGNETEVVSRNVEDAQSDYRRLAYELRALENQLEDSARLIEELERTAGGDVLQGPEIVTSLEDNVTELESELLRQHSEKTTLQQDNDQLKQQLATSDNVVRELEAMSEARAKAEQELKQAKVKITILLDDAKAARLAEQTQRRTVEGLVVKVPALEQEAAGLRDELTEKATHLENSLSELDTIQRDLGNSVRELETMRAAIEQREYRVRKSERIARLIEETREQVRISDLEERHHLHFSLAAVYKENGQAEKARQHYLQAINVDPSDASSHYKLAHLYDDVFGDKRMAAMHYRAYLKLSPDAEDVDEVKRWLTSRDVK
jgi:chromosome segregation ATPase